MNADIPDVNGMMTFSPDRADVAAAVPLKLYFLGVHQHL
jgi:hypothetical protein